MKLTVMVNSTIFKWCCLLRYNIYLLPGFRIFHNLLRQGRISLFDPRQHVNYHTGIGNIEAATVRTDANHETAVKPVPTVGFIKRIFTRRRSDDPIEILLVGLESVVIASSVLIGRHDEFHAAALDLSEFFRKHIPCPSGMFVPIDIRRVIGMHVVPTPMRNHCNVFELVLVGPVDSLAHDLQRSGGNNNQSNTFCHF